MLEIALAALQLYEDHSAGYYSSYRFACYGAIRSDR